MALSTKEIKARYFKKKHDEAPTIDCLCGCGEKIKSVDEYGRPKGFVSGHNGRKYADKYGHKKAWVKRNRDWVNERRQRISRERKLFLMSLKESVCKDCGLKYNGMNGSVFHFHHINPENKEMAIGSNLNNITLDTLIREVEKCELLCSNCHAIKHQGEW